MKKKYRITKNPKFRVAIAIELETSTAVSNAGPSDITGATVTDIQIDAPSLQAVFIHLTGRELRE